MNNPPAIARKSGARKRFMATIASFLLGVAAALPASAAGLIRDAEIEDTLWMYLRPVLQQAGLNEGAVHVFLVNDPSINAFVAGGANIFIHTGLITTTRNAGMLIGVLAHETGHIAGGHLIRTKEAMSGANIGLLVATVLGAAAAVGGGGDVAMGTIAAGQSMAQNAFLSYSRGQESAADQAAIRFLDGAGWSSKGMLEMFEVLRQKEHRMFGMRDPYMSTHPMAQDRVTTLRSHVLQSALADAAMPKPFEERHARMVAKLRGFMEAPEYTLASYGPTDQSIAAHMGRAVAYFRQGQLPKARAEMDAALKLAPKDPYLYDLKGQIVFESGQVAEAIACYRTAAQALPNNPMVLSDYARALLATEQVRDVAEATRALEHATAQDATHTAAWDLLAVAYGKSNQKPKAALAQAEAALLRNQPKEALSFLRLASTGIGRNSPAGLRIEDLRALAKEQIKAQQEKA